jgi:exodeoxyribonuclease VII large subunit
MPEKRDHITIFSLSEVARSIQKTISERYTQAYWIKAEMNKLNLYSHSGHCYPELVEKLDGRVITEMRALLWRTDYERVQQKFLSVLGEELSQGITILFLANIQYDPMYGLSLRILDIDPSYSLGVLEQERQASIARLKSEGLFDANKNLPFPLLPKRIAVISVETSKGYADFLKIIQQNPWGFKIEHTLFPALLQGHRSVGSIIGQLDLIRQHRDQFDVVILVRGGGGEVGLTSYNQYELAATVAAFPIPVLTGIGHATNETVTEMVAYKQAVTPSELAEFLLYRFRLFSEQIQKHEESLRKNLPQLLKDTHRQLRSQVERLYQEVQQSLSDQKHQIERMQWSFRHQVSQHLDTATHQLNHQKHHLSWITSQLFSEAKQTLQHQEKIISLLDPNKLLKRGYSLTYIQGALLTEGNQVRPGDLIETHIHQGKIVSTVQQITND